MRDAVVLLQLITGTVAVCSVLQGLRQTSVDWRTAEHNSVMFCLDAERRELKSSVFSLEMFLIAYIS